MKRFFQYLILPVVCYLFICWFIPELVFGRSTKDSTSQPVFEDVGDALMPLTVTVNSNTTRGVEFSTATHFNRGTTRKLRIYNSHSNYRLHITTYATTLTEIKVSSRSYTLDVTTNPHCFIDLQTQTTSFFLMVDDRGSTTTAKVLRFWNP